MSTEVSRKKSSHSNVSSCRFLSSEAAIAAFHWPFSLLAGMAIAFPEDTDAFCHFGVRVLVTCAALPVLICGDFCLTGETRATTEAIVKTPDATPSCQIVAAGQL